jgi:hypothetical protein
MTITSEDLIRELVSGVASMAGNSKKVHASFDDAIRRVIELAIQEHLIVADQSKNTTLH